MSTLPEGITPEQDEQLRKHYAEKLGVQLGPDGQPVKEQDAAAPTTETVYTNLTDTDVTISDLGVKSAEGFESEKIGPYEVKDFAHKYSGREIRQSKRLVQLCDDKILAKGKVSTDALKANMDPLARMAREMPTGSFTDPQQTPLRNQDPNYTAQNDYDKRLGELLEKDHQEDLETRQNQAR